MSTGEHSPRFSCSINNLHPHGGARMALHRLIHRLDYSFNETICDRPGSVINIIMKVGGAERYPEVNDSAPTRNLVADGKAEDGSKWRLQVSPLNMFIVFEWLAPRRIGNILKDPDVKASFDILEAIQKHSQIDETTRAGFRVFSYAHLAGSNVLESTLRRIDPDVVELLTKRAGEIADVGINFDGKTENGLSYSARHGPYFDKEHKKYFDLLKDEQVSGEENYNFITDIDFAQNNFRIKGQWSYGWCRALLDQANNVTEGLMKTGSKK